MNEYPCLTIAVPTYNRCESVVAVVERIVPQLQPGDEFLVVDDGSEDATSDTLRAVPDVRVLSSPTNHGITKTWNACLTAASNEWICLVHDDDLIAIDALSTIRRACALAHGPALVGHMVVGTDLDRSFRCRLLDPGRWAVEHCCFVPSGTTVHKAIVNAGELFDERFLYSPDIEYFARICARYRSLVIESPWVVHSRQHERNHQYETWRQPDFMEQLEEIERLFASYCGLSGEAATALFRRRMGVHGTWMLSGAALSEDRGLVRRVGLMLRDRSYLGRRVRLMAYSASVLNWYPSLA